MVLESFPNLSDSVISWWAWILQIEGWVSSGRPSVTDRAGKGSAFWGHFRWSCKRTKPGAELVLWPLKDQFWQYQLSSASWPRQLSHPAYFWKYLLCENAETHQGKEQWTMSCLVPQNHRKSVKTHLGSESLYVLCWFIIAKSEVQGMWTDPSACVWVLSLCIFFSLQLFQCLKEPCMVLK